MCTHHWVIAPPNGVTSEGVCKLCGATKRFENSVLYSDKDWSLVQSARRHRADGIDDDLE